MKYCHLQYERINCKKTEAAEFKEFAPQFKLKQQLKCGMFHLKSYSMF